MDVRGIVYRKRILNNGMSDACPAKPQSHPSKPPHTLQLLKHGAESRTCLAACCLSDVPQHVLPGLMEQLELIQKSLSAYLESKRGEFARFYFVADATLLEILSLGSDPAAVIPHFQSGLFDGLYNLVADAKDASLMLAMESPEGEVVPFAQPVQARGNAEVWLQSVLHGMQVRFG